jgi:hypothetical protein
MLPFADERFLPLRDMQSFTDDMFNRTIAFQEKQHAAWDESLPFAERIEGLPLHYLIFSNPDRDPAKLAPTVAPYYPLREELRTLVYLARQVASDPVVLDVHGGNGFIGSLLAREGVSVIGLRDPAAKPNQIRNFYDPAFYTPRDVPFEQVDFPIDVVFSSWMPSGVNMTPALLARRPKLAIFVFTDQIDDSGSPLTGTPEAFRELPESYRVVAEWDITRPQDLLKEVWPDLTGNPELVRRVRVVADEPYHDIELDGLQPATPYSWEKELEMALLAREAKERLRLEGYPVD